MVKSLYVLFMAVLVLGFFGFGISAFYPRPSPEDFKTGDIAESEDFSDEKAFLAVQAYNREVSIVAIISAIVVLSLGLLLPVRFSTLADGAILGGVFTLSYGIWVGAIGGGAMFRFITVSIGLPVALGLGYFRFVRRS